MPCDSVGEETVAALDQIDAEARGNAAERYQLLNVNAGTTGTAAGEV